MEEMQRILGVGKFTPQKLETLPNSPEHQVDITCGVSYGHYAWC